MSTPYCKLYDKKTSTAQAILDRFSIKTENTLILNVSDILS